jgi:hypothetical protein
MLAPHHRNRLLMLTGITVCAAVFVGASKLFHVPATPGFSASILGAPSPTVSFLVVAAALLVCVLVGTLITGRVRFDAGLFCAVLGMLALSLRSGTVGDVLRATAGQGGGATAFMGFAAELLLLYAVLGLGWSVLWLLHRQDYLKADQFRDGVEETHDPVVIKVCALLMQAAGTALCMIVLVQTDSKTQVLWSVAAASYLGAILAHVLYPVSPSPWLWVGPMLVGVTGYVTAYLKLAPSDVAWRTGQLRFSLAPLARALPVDYVTAGTAGAVLGYWMSRKWQQQRAEGSGESPAAREEAMEQFFGKPG